MIRVLLADDEELVRSGLRMILAAEPELDVVAEATDGASTVAMAGECSPDVILMDIKMTGLDGIEATRRIVVGASPPKVVILTTFDRSKLVFDALTAGASGFLLKDTPTAQLVAGIQAVTRGEELLSPSITRRLVEEFIHANRLPPPPGFDKLTEREREVLALVSRGLSNAEISRDLYVSLQTVKTHVARILAKLELRDRVQAVVAAYESGLVRPGD
jgi:DNA-binding NarL/FixJ family response regulator